MDLDLRKLRYFVAVAEELHFGRAADRLHIAQPVLSRQIRVLEDELKARLFARDHRGTALTPAGEQLLIDARALLREAEATQRRLRRAADGTRRFVVGFMPGLIVTAPVRALRTAHPDLTVDVLRTGWNDQVETLHDGRVDVGYLRLPVDQRGLAVRPLFAEPRVAMLPVEHRLSGKPSLPIADLADEHLLQPPDAVPEWRDIATELRDRVRRPAVPVYSVEEKLERVAAGEGVILLPESTAAFYRRSDVVAVPVTDVADNQVCLAWTAGRQDPLIDEFVLLAVAGALAQPGSCSHSRSPSCVEPGGLGEPPSPATPDNDAGFMSRTSDSGH